MARTRHILISLALFVSAVILPVGTAFASAAGTQAPTGASAHTYTYNDDTGKWENSYFIWDPATHMESPKEIAPYTYNSNTHLWDSYEWQFNAAADTYEKATFSVASPPAGAKTIGSPPATNTTTNDSSASGDTTASVTASAGNQLTSSSQSGNTSAVANTTIGNAASGDATGVSNIMNLLNSSIGAAPVTFTSTINGDVSGDILIDPAQLSKVESSNSVQQIKVDNGTGINNTIAVDAKTGDTTLANNTTAGNATTGNANAVANVMNLVNSNIATGQSFVGVVNIQGNLNGDILLPPEVLSQLLASNTPTITIPSESTSTANATVTDNQSIHNQVSLGASSGNATADANTVAGIVKTGDSKTNLTLLNLTGSDIIGSNAMLVFVNVLGTWKGMIINAPTGSTAAALGSGIAQNNSNAESSTDITSNTGINNTIMARATSGDVNASKNTTVGNVSSGNTTASANILNLSNTHLAFSNWFGILFINVFGSWNGSFGINTSAGDPVAAPSTTSSGSSSPTPAARVFSFVPTKRSNNSVVQTATVSAAPSTQDQTQEVQETKTVVLGANEDTHTPASPSNNGGNALTPILGSILGMTLLGTERVMAARGKRKSGVMAPIKHSYTLLRRSHFLF